MKVLATTMLAIIAAALPGCAATTAEDAAERERREYLRRDYEARFVEFRRQCLSHGGTVVVDSLRDLRRNGVPRPGSFYRCTR